MILKVQDSKASLIFIVQKIIFGIKVEGPLFDTLDLENQPKVAYEYKQTITLKFYQNSCVEVNITNYISQEVLYPKIGAK